MHVFKNLILSNVLLHTNIMSGYSVHYFVYPKRQLSIYEIRTYFEQITKKEFVKFENVSIFKLGGHLTSVW